MAGYSQYCPIALTAEIVSERWTLLIIRELLMGGRRFNELRNGVPKMSATLLTKRLDQLENSGLITKRKNPDGKGSVYFPTDACEELRPIIEEFGKWGQRWARHHSAKERDPGFLIWDMRRRVNRSALPPGRTVVEFTYSDVAPKLQRTWLVCSRNEVDACIKWPGFEIDILVNTRISTMIDVWMGRIPLRKAIRSNLIRLNGPADLKRDFHKWLMLAPMAEHGRPIKGLDPGGKPTREAANER